MSVAPDEAAMTSVLQSTGPLSALMDATQLQFYKSGVWTGGKTAHGGCASDGSYLNHAVLLVGFASETDGTDYWTGKSHGARSGEKKVIFAFSADLASVGSTRQ